MTSVPAFSSVEAREMRLHGPGGTMFSKCSNPDCSATFDYRQGRLIRFDKPSSDFPFPTDRNCVQHFWLCENCSTFYALDFERGTGMKIKIRVIPVSERHVPVDPSHRESSRTADGARAVTSQRSILF